MTHYRFTTQTVVRVALVHMAVILFLLIPIHLLFRKEPKFIEMVNLGSSDPGLGTPGPPQPAPKPQPTPQPEPKPKSKPKPVSKPKPKPKSVPKPKPKPKSKPKPKPKPKKKIKISKKLVTRKTSATPSASQKTKTPSAREIERELKQGFRQNIGVRSGNPNKTGNAGAPSGKASWYHALIRETFLKNWKKPQLPGAAKLETFVSIRIAPNGAVTFLGISKPSGNETMDASVLQAARSVQKISQPLPSGLGNPDYEVAINFRLD